MSLFAALKLWRNQLARVMGKPPYMLVSNAALEEIAQTQPSTHLELQMIKGMGPVKVRQFGGEIIGVVKKWKEEQGKTDDEPTAWDAEVPKPLTTHSLSSIEQDNKKLTQGVEMVFRVGEYLDLVNEMLFQVQAVIEGEVGKVDRRGNYTFFTLVDGQEEAVLQCFVWEHRLRNLGVSLVEGMKVRVAGFGRLYKQRGTFSFEITHVGLVGEGAVKQAFEQLKARLEAEGLFDRSVKQTIPEYPVRIGLVTSKYADAKKDFLTHLGEFGYQIFHYDVRVEGVYAVDEIVQAIRWFNESKSDIDVLVITRGGGSWESLQAFNTEQVAKAIRASKIPIVTGIGHENDETIADWCADVRCSTPTDAGKFLSQGWRSAEENLRGHSRWLDQGIKNLLEEKKLQQKNLAKHLGYEMESYIQQLHYQMQNTLGRYETGRQRLKTAVEDGQRKILLLGKELHRKVDLQEQKVENIEERMKTQAHKAVLDTAAVIDALEQRIETGHPQRRLAQGYSIITKDGGRLVKSAEMLHPGEDVHAMLERGTAKFKVVEAEVRERSA